MRAPASVCPLHLVVASLALYTLHCSTESSAPDAGATEAPVDTGQSNAGRTAPPPETRPTPASGAMEDADRAEPDAVQASDALPPEGSPQAEMPDAGDATVDAGAPSAGDATGTRRLATPPVYTGNNPGSSGCGGSYATLGFEPDTDPDAAYPLFLYFVGTTFSDSDLSARHDSEAAMAVTEAMARRGFVALSVEYDNTLSFSPDKLGCMYGDANPQSLLAVACGLPQVDCDAGIATWGHSQGALMAHAASQYDVRVRAVWTTGYSGGTFPLPPDRLRVVNGAGDFMNGSVDVLNRAAGLSAAECPDDGRSECLRQDGSGWIQVRQEDCVESSADHCWFDKRSCIDDVVVLEPNWTDPASEKAFALELNADWVARTVRRAP